MMKRLVSIFIQGLIAVLPLAVTLFILIWLGSAAERFFGIAVQSILPDAWYVTGMGVACGIGSVFIVGVLINLWGVPRLIRLAEKLIDRIPLVKTIYGAVRDLLGYFSKSDERGTRKVVMVCIGDTGMRTLGLLTRDHFDDLPPGVNGGLKVQRVAGG